MEPLLQNTTMVNGSITDNFIEHSGEHGVYVEDTGNSNTDWNLTDNWIGGAEKDGIHMDNAAGWVVERNHTYGVKENAIYADRLFGTSISDNYIEDFGGTKEKGTYYGIYGTVQGDATSVISNNRIHMGSEINNGLTYRYIGIGKVNYGEGVLNVNGNALRGKSSGEADTTGLYFNGGSNTLWVMSSGKISHPYERKNEIGG